MNSKFGLIMSLQKPFLPQTLASFIRSAVQRYTELMIFGSNKNIYWTWNSFTNESFEQRIEWGHMSLKQRFRSCPFRLQLLSNIIITIQTFYCILQFRSIHMPHHITKYRHKNNNKKNASTCFGFCLHYKRLVSLNVQRGAAFLKCI